MKVIFASLALLALFKSSCGEMAFWAFVDTFALQYKMNASTFYIPDDIQTENYDKIVVGNLTGFRYLALSKVLGNTIYAMIWHKLGLYETLPAYYRRALENGVLCEVQLSEPDVTIISIQYQAEELTEEQREREDEAEKEIGYDCEKFPSPPTGDFCSCRRQNVLLYCAAFELKMRILNAGVTKKTCESDIMDTLITELRTANSFQHLAAPYFSDDMKRHYAITISPRPEHEWQSLNPARYCATTDPESHATVRAIFAANALRWTLEGVAMQTVFNGTHGDLDIACAVKNFKTSELGKCACTKDTGIAFCVQKTRAEYYKKIGYLNCTNGAKFEGSKTPDTLPPFICYSDSVASATLAECAEYRKEMN